MNKALEILARATRETEAKEKRSTQLLKPVEGPSQGWFMYVPEFFNAALDILQTERVVERESVVDGKTVVEKQSEFVWTQGPNFSFAVGDTIYDSEGGYAEFWSDAIKQITYCLSVTSAVSASPRTSTTPRTKGSVAFDIFVPTADKSKLEKQSTKTMTQDDFVRLLINGDGLK